MSGAVSRTRNAPPRPLTVNQDLLNTYAALTPLPAPFASGSTVGCADAVGAPRPRPLPLPLPLMFFEDELQVNRIVVITNKLRVNRSPS